MFETRALPRGKMEKLKIPKKPAVSIIKQPEEFKSINLTAGKLLLPGIGKFPCIDLFIGPDKLFQVTVSAHHPLKYRKLKEMVENIQENPTASKQELQIYFVVPQDIYDDFKRQNYINESGNVCKKLDPVVKNIKQYVLKFDLFAANTGQTPGLGGGAAH